MFRNLMGGIIQVGSVKASVVRKIVNRYMDASMPLDRTKDQLASGWE
jgi:hypothetical protein